MDPFEFLDGTAPELNTACWESVANESPDEGGLNNVEYLPPWHGTDIPQGYELSERGVLKIIGDNEKWICGPVWEVSKTRDYEGQQWGTVLCWIDYDGNLKTEAFPVSKLHDGKNGSIIAHLASRGLHIVPGCDKSLLEYLGLFNQGKRMRSTSQTGWVPARDNCLIYVLPGKIISRAETEGIIFQPERHSPSALSLHGRGTLDEWKYKIAAPCADNPILLLSELIGFASPLLKFADMDSCGFHIHGSSSQGKTTALQVAASVWGNGGDPGSSPDSYIQRWNSTANALEALAAAHNDNLLALDEMGTCDAHDFGNVVYNLAGGKGRNRLSKDASLQASRQWRSMFLSSGEISVQQKIAEGGKTVKGGQVNRMIDIPVVNSIIHETRGQTPQRFADDLKRAAGECYGVAGPAFIQKLVTENADANVLRHMVRQRLDECTEALLPKTKISQVQHRVIRRFALVLLAGYLAVEYGILPCSKAQIEHAVKTSLNAWLQSSVSESVRGVLAVRDFISRHQESKFLDMANAGKVRHQISDLAGYWDPKDNHFIFTEEAFQRASGGNQAIDVATELRQQGLLFMNDGTRLKAKKQIPGRAERSRFYTVKAEILDYDATATD